MDELKAGAVYSGGCDASATIVEWFWKALEAFTEEQRGMFLKFCTGTSRVPLDGFEPPFTVTLGSDMTPDALPRSHTCFNQIVLPPYEAEDVLVSKVAYAISQTDGFTLT